MATVPPRMRFEPAARVSTSTPRIAMRPLRRSVMLASPQRRTISSRASSSTRRPSTRASTSSSASERVIGVRIPA